MGRWKSAAARYSAARPRESLRIGPPLVSGIFIRPPSRPRSINRALSAVDDDDRLYVAEAGTRDVLIFDLWSSRLLRRVALPGRPLDLAVDSGGVLVLLAEPFALVRLTREPDLSLKPCRSTWSLHLASRFQRRESFLCSTSGTESATVRDIPTPFASDIEFLCDGADSILVAARLPNEDLLRFRITADSIEELRR